MPSTIQAATARTTVVRPSDPSLSAAIRLALAFAAVKLALHIVLTLYTQHLGYSYFRDEFYYIMCGRRLAWGYVDHGPLVAVQARLAETLFGTSLLGIRLLSHLAGAVVVFLTGILAWALGGRRSAQSLALLGVLLAPQYLGTHSFLSMNSVEPIFWMFSTLAVIRIVSGASARKWWILFGISAGLGLLNKPSMTFFLIALVLGLLLTPQRRVLFTRWTALALGLLVAIASPNLLWQVHNHWPTLEFLHNGQAGHKNVVLPFSPSSTRRSSSSTPSAPCSGSPASSPSCAPAPSPTCAGSASCTSPSSSSCSSSTLRTTTSPPSTPSSSPPAPSPGNTASPAPTARRDRLFAFPIYETALLVTGLLILPMAIPVLPPQTWFAYTTALHLHNSANETASTGAFPQFYADRFGWQQEVDLVNQAFQSLSPDDRARVSIFANNYGEAGAIDFLGGRQHLGLPPATSPQNNYWIWGPSPRGVDPTIAVLHDTPAELHEKYASVTVIGHIDNPYAMPFEHKTVYLLRNRLPNNPFNWQEEKDYF